MTEEAVYTSGLFIGGSLLPTIADHHGLPMYELGNNCSLVHGIKEDKISSKGNHDPRSQSHVDLTSYHFSLYDLT
jgi:hypothetical protein